jgi:DNA polymerase III sliding clamp (beta) subunit (PCNA family)
MTIGRQPLLDAIEHTRQFTGNTKVGIKFQVREDVIEITSASSEFGEAKEAIEVEAAGEPFVAGYNAEYICEFLKAIETSPRIRFAFKDRESAAELRPGELQAPYIYRYVLMPCAVG